MTSVLFYVQHLLGVGHLARASLIAEALVEAGLDVLMVTGGAPVPGFPGERVRTLSLPAVKMGEGGFSALARLDGSPTDEEFLARRRTMLLRAFDDLRPDILLVEAYPFGRRQMRFELTPLLERARKAEWRPLVVCSVRDVLQETRKAGRAEEVLEVVRRDFDLVLVHGDPEFLPFETTFPLTEEIKPRIRYTGLVAGPVTPLDGERFDIVVSAGGGAAGASLMRAAREACDRLAASGWTWGFLTGPNLPADVREALASDLPANARLANHRRDFRALLKSARLSISQAGYNTAADVLQAGCRAIMAPFAQAGETEQTRRAEALQARGLAEVIAEADLSAERLARMIENAMEARAVREGPLPRLDGAHACAPLLLDALRKKRAGA